MKHFKEYEFVMDGEQVFDKMDDDFLDMLDSARGFAGVPFRITSSYRTPEYNALVRGNKNSSHLRGLAVDLSVDAGVDRFKIVRGLMTAGFQRIGIGDNFIHVDNDLSLPYPSIWTY